MDINKLNLNNAQIEAVKTINGPILVVAGAGTGKTKVLTTRLSYIIENTGCPDYRILAITFTNIACSEMKARVNGLLGKTVQAKIFTYHGLCSRILQKDIVSIGGAPDFRIIDEEEKLTIINQIYRDLNLNKDFATRCKSKLMIEMIAQIIYSTIDELDIYSTKTCELQQVSDKIKKHILLEEDNNHINDIYRRYQKLKKTNNWLDFDDLITGVYKLFNKHPEIAEKWANRFDYILVDEFQDTDCYQFAILKKIINNNQNVFAVGDPDQTIYEWRGAYSYIFKDFIKSFPNTKIIILDKNYRSNQNILNVANELISHNNNRIKKNLVTDSLNSEQVIYYYGDSQHEEGKFIAQKINELINKHHLEYKDITILYRSNYLSRFIEKALIDFGIPYFVYGSIKFYQRKEIKDILAYLRLINHENDELAIKRVINVPSRKIGEATINKIDEYAKENNITFAQAIFSNQNETNWNASKINDFVKTIKFLQNQAKIISPSELCKKIVETIGYAEYLMSYLSEEEAKNKMDNINELINSIKEYENENPGSSIDNFLQSIALYIDTSIDDNKSKQDFNTVSLMTVHFAKGSEYKAVFIVGLYEGVFPIQRLAENTDIEEERRVLFVGITRAKQYLFLTSSSFFSYGRSLFESSFIQEIGEKNLKRVVSRFTPLSKNDETWFNSQDTKDYSTMYEKKAIQYSIGDQVVHTVFGIGHIVGIENDVLTIVFKKPYGIKTIIGTHKSLKRIMN